MELYESLVSAHKFTGSTPQVVDFGNASWLVSDVSKLGWGVDVFIFDSFEVL